MNIQISLLSRLFYNVTAMLHGTCVAESTASGEIRGEFGILLIRFASSCLFNGTAIRIRILRLTYAEAYSFGGFVPRVHIMTLTMDPTGGSPGPNPRMGSLKAPVMM
jgi:hypothetical protein